MSISTIVTRFWPGNPYPVQQPINHLTKAPATLPGFVQACPVAMSALKLLSPIPWDAFPDRFQSRNWLYVDCMSDATLTAACLIRLEQRMCYTSQLVSYLRDHPALIWLLGFPLTPDKHHPFGFDPVASLPSQRQFNRRLRGLDQEVLQWLFDQTVRCILTELRDVDPALGDTISLDTKHIIAFVKENNPKAYVKDRYNKDRQPKGDPDCKLGVKRRHNLKITSKPQATPTTNPVPFHEVSVGEYYWGYGSGVVATKVPGWGEFVLAEFTQPFNKGDTTYFFPLISATERRLGRQPRFGAFDAAFDAFYVYEHFHAAGGLAAVPFAEKGKTAQRQFSPEGLPLCKANLPMPVRTIFTDRTKTIVVHQRARYGCSLFYPTRSDQPCPIQHPRWLKGGCTVEMPTSIGARLRYQIDRKSAAYSAVYQQRTATERINSQAKNLGIERPRLRNGAAIANLNSLIYTLINLRFLRRIQDRKAAD
jgi:transposase